MLAVAVCGQALLAVALIGVGLWGRSRSTGLPASSLEGEERRRRAAVIERGAWGSILIGVLFAASAVVALF